MLRAPIPTAAMLLLTALVPAPTTGGDALSGAASGSLHSRLDRYMTGIEAFGYSGAAVVVKQGSVVLSSGYGLADRERSRPMTPSTLIDVGSVTKQFTAAAILRLEEDGRLHQTDTLGALLPGVPADKAGISIRQLLTHMSGVAAPYGPRARFGHDETLRRILGTDLQFSPGSRQRYSNAGYTLLAAIIQQASGERYQDFVRRRLFDAAGLRNATFRGLYPDGLTVDSVAVGYDGVGTEVDPHTWSDTTWADLGAAGVLMSAKDLAHWITAIMADSVFPAQWRQRLLTPLTPDTGRLGGYGYGLQVQHTKSGKMVIHHEGDATAYGAGVAWYPTQRLLVVSTCNIRHDLYPTHLLSDEVIPKIVFGEPFDAPPAVLPHDAAFARALVGRYQLSSGGVLEIDSGAQGITIGAEGQDAIDALDGAPADTMRERARLTVLTRKLVDGWFRGDTLPLSAALGSGGDAKDFGGAMVNEMNEAAGHPITGRTVLGTGPGGGPWGSMNSIVRLEYDGGWAPYKIKWLHGLIDNSGPRSERFPLIVPLASVERGAFAGWNIVTQRGFRLAVRSRANGMAQRLTISRKGGSWDARRISAPQP
jgi:CubicO group peptidase (beta-lactamase class C family)